MRLRPWLYWVLLPLALATALVVWHYGRHRHPAPVGALRDATHSANIVICVLDAARPDHMGCYGYPRATTPNIDRIARESLVFERHFTSFPGTRASTASLFTSQYPDTHLVRDDDLDHVLDETSFTLAKGLDAAGFKTALFSSNPYFGGTGSIGISGQFQSAFTLLDVSLELREGETRFSPEPLLRIFTRWLDSAAASSRFFAYLHFMPPHEPYDAPAEMKALFADKQPPGYRAEDYRPGRYDFPIGNECREHPPLPEWINLYDANFRYGDWVIGEVERMLTEAGILENTILVVTADHGEAFGEHGYVYHGTSPHDEASRVPLIVRFPRQVATGRIPALTQSIDLLPTIFELFDLPYPRDEVQGRSLLPLVSGQADSVNDYVFTRATALQDDPLDLAKYMVRGERYALLLYKNGTWRALYDLQADPKEQVNVIREQASVARSMLDVFGDFARQQKRPPLAFLDAHAKRPEPAPAPNVELTPQEKEDLRALGYLR